MGLKGLLTKFRLKNGKGVSLFVRSHFFSWFLVGLIAAISTILSNLSFQRMPRDLTEGAIAAHNIKADRNYEISDEEATEGFRDEARAGVLPVYDFDDRVASSIEKRIHDAFSSARALLEKGLKGLREAHPFETMLQDKLGIAIEPAEVNAIKSERFNTYIETALSTIIHKVMSQPVVAERGSLDAEKGKGIVLRRIKPEGAGGVQQFEEKVIPDVGRLISSEEARSQIAKTPRPLVGIRNTQVSSAIIGVAHALIEPNCVFNRTETQKRRDEAAANVKKVILKVKAGEMIIREGSRYEQWHLKVLRGIQEERRRGMYSVEFIGTFLLILMFIVVPFYIAGHLSKRIRPAREDYTLMAVVGLLVLAIMRLSIILAPALQGTIFLNATISVLNFAIPIAGGAMLLKMFLGTEITLVFAIVVSLVAGVFVEASAHFVVFSLISNFIAIIAIANADRRSLIIRAGVITGGIGALMFVAIHMTEVARAPEAITVKDFLWGITCAFMGGIGGSIFAMIMAPVIESLSGFTSDIKLLELANLNHPLLRELIVRAPGTYHHSHMVGILGEAAAEAIGAKALLVRVGAYYHDIGKMKKPLYFIENAKVGENKHEKLSPHMSSLIISAHVKDGLDMAGGARIPKVIADMIPQHQGTRLISFFYEKAKEVEDSSVQKVDRKDFVYPGPKPQTREAAILMLADAVEAAVRALKEKGSTRIQQTVQRVITDIFAEKQLDECELTLKDLNEIAQAFGRILLGIYHSRIEYPKETGHEKKEQSIVDEPTLLEDSDQERSSNLPPKSGGH